MPGQMRRQPVPDRGLQGRIAEVRPAGIGLDPPHQRDPGLELAGGVGPWQRAQVLGRDDVGERLGGQRRIAGFGAVGQHQRAQPAAAARQHRAG